MEMKWTDEQKEVINIRNQNILVSAAAGSGKTAVLVERIIQKLMDKSVPFEIDRLLVVTFTEAAAAEMKERIRDAIERKLEDEPENEHLQKQAILIHSARIMTIDSFCLSVIRDYFHAIDLDPGFRTAEEGELKLLRQDVLEKMLEDHYEEGDEAFCEFVESFATGRDDRTIEEIILNLYSYSSSYPYPQKWLDGCLKVYGIEDEFEEREDVSKAKDRAKNYLQDSLLLLAEGIKICEEEDGPSPYLATLLDDAEQLRDIIECTGFSKMRESIANITWQRIATINKKKAEQEGYHEEKMVQVKSIRETVKGLVKELQTGYFAETKEQILADMKLCWPMVQVLVELVKEFAEKFASQKRSKNIIDFNDMEHLALQILENEQIAKDYREQLDEIMVDEYQDSNLLQEAILTSVSRLSQEEYNIFMVGDVKQSIYRFRQARPELFMEKFAAYPEQEHCVRIDLHKNFRSREEVINSVNSIFTRIMIPSLGGILYDDRAKLHVGATYENQEGVTSEAILVHMDSSKEAQDTLEYTQREFEAKAVAKRIKELLCTQKVLDKKTGEYRLATYRDIVILTRSLKGWTNVFSEVLQAEGIPAYTTNKEGYFETLEIGVLLDYLKILDNRRQDIPLASVLKSYFVGLVSEELAVIQAAYRAVPFHEAVAKYIENGSNEVLRKRLLAFVEQLENYRAMLPYTAIHTLLWKIIHETGYGEYMAAYPGGSQRKANLEMLVEKALTYESTSYKGLFHFVRYVEQLKKYEVDYGEANIIDEQSDAIRLMSIHKSKGLEFPIVIVAGMGKAFNTQDAKSKVVLHPTLGVGIQAIDVNLRTRNDTLYRKVIQQETKIENLGEELRVLYVALTRAKEKIILLGTVTNWEKKQAEYQLYAKLGHEGLPFSYLAKKGNYYDWVLAAIGGEESAELLVRHFNTEDLLREEFIETLEAKMDKNQFLTWDGDVTYDEEFKERIETQFTYKYPQRHDASLKRKYTVSDLKRLGGLPEEIGEELYAQPEVVPFIPQFISKEQVLSGTSKGNAYHKVMEQLDFALDYTEEMLDKQLIRFVQKEKITLEEYECIVQVDILSLLRSELGKRMTEAAKRAGFYKEQPFVIRAEEGYLVQGIVDAYFVEDEEIVIVDYKTDIVKSGEQLKERYQIQLDYYGEALAKLMRKDVKQKVIYSFHLHEKIEL